ncbi:MAG TPA: hypothetical protein VJL80_10685 [Aeromicrobium sp.]|nr:hypothetical protein [Aeromicrobium sp.]HKY58496.1 hypothetical protein [Aeromicrobium sp.]
MIAFYIALVLGGVIAAAYIALGYAEFQRARKSYDQTAVTSEEDLDAQGQGFTWIALGGVVASTTLLVLISHTSWAWYILPFLSLGSALAVVAAFVVDREEAETQSQGAA